MLITLSNIKNILIIFVTINPVNIWLVEPVNNSKPDIWYVFIRKDTITEPRQSVLLYFKIAGSAVRSKFSGLDLAVR